MRLGLRNTAIAFLQTALPLLIILIVNYATVQDAQREPERPLSLNAEETSLGCVESINAHSLQTSQSHVPVAWMVSPANSENNLIIIVPSGSGSSESRLLTL